MRAASTSCRKLVLQSQSLRDALTGHRCVALRRDCGRHVVNQSVGPPLRLQGGLGSSQQQAQQRWIGGVPGCIQRSGSEDGPRLTRAKDDWASEVGLVPMHEPAIGAGQLDARGPKT
jgi:hypothetical protein